MSETRRRHVPWYLWPLWAVWLLLTFVLEATGRLAAALLGVALVAVGTVLTLTLVAAPVGIPLALLGVLLLLRSLF